MIPSGVSDIKFESHHFNTMLKKRSKDREEGRGEGRREEGERKGGGFTLVSVSEHTELTVYFLLSYTVQTQWTTKYPFMHRTAPVLALETQHLEKSPGPRQSGTTAYPDDKVPHKDVLTLHFPFIPGSILHGDGVLILEQPLAF